MSTFGIDDLNVGKISSGNSWLDDITDDGCGGILNPSVTKSKTDIDDFLGISSTLPVPPLFAANTVNNAYNHRIINECGNSSPLSPPAIPSPTHYPSTVETPHRMHQQIYQQPQYVGNGSVLPGSRVEESPLSMVSSRPSPSPAPRGLEERYGQNPAAPSPQGFGVSQNNYAVSPSSVGYAESNTSSPYTFEQRPSISVSHAPSNSTSPYSLAPNPTANYIPQNRVQLASYPSQNIPMASYAAAPVYSDQQFMPLSTDAHTPPLAPTASVHSIPSTVGSQFHSLPSSGSTSPVPASLSPLPTTAGTTAPITMTTRSSTRRPRPSSGNDESPLPSASATAAMTTRKRRTPATATVAAAPSVATRGKSSSRRTTLERTPSSGPSSDDDENDHSMRNAKAQELVANSSAVRAAAARAAELTPIIIPGGDGEDDSALRRQRNKISASQYRKRRKVFVELLEEKVAEMELMIKQQTEMIQQMQEQINRPANRQPIPAHMHAHPHHGAQPMMPSSHPAYPQAHAVPVHSVDNGAYHYPTPPLPHYTAAHTHAPMVHGAHTYAPHYAPQHAPALSAGPHSAPTTPPHAVGATSPMYYNPVVDEESSNVSRWAVRTAVMFAFFSCLLLMAIPPVYQTEEYGSTNTLVGYLGVPELELDLSLDRELQTVQMWGRKLLAMDFDMSNSSRIGASIVHFFSQFGLLGIVSWAQSWLHYVCFDIIGIDPRDPYLLWVLAILFGVALLVVRSAWSFLVVSAQDCGQRTVAEGCVDESLDDTAKTISKAGQDSVDPRSTGVCAVEDVTETDVSEPEETSSVPEVLNLYHGQPETDVDSDESAFVYGERPYAEEAPLPSEDSDLSEDMHNCTTEEEEDGEVSQDEKYTIESPERELSSRARLRTHASIEAF